MGKQPRVSGIGIDIVEIAGIRGARFTKRFAEYFLTERELERVPKGSKKIEFLASRFATKEAVIKAFPHTLKPHDFTIEKRGVRPCIVFSSKKYELRYTVNVSLSHTKNIAAAVAIVSEREA